MKYTITIITCFGIKFFLSSWKSHGILSLLSRFISVRTHNVTAVVIVSNIMLSYHCLRFEYSHNIVLRTKVHKRYTRTDVYAFRIVFSGRRKYVSEGRRRNLDRTTLAAVPTVFIKRKNQTFFLLLLISKRDRITTTDNGLSAV